MNRNNPFLIARRKAILAAIAEGIRKDGYAPSIRALVAQVGVRSTSVISYHLDALERAGYLHRPSDDNGKMFAHTMSLTPKGETLVEAPISPVTD